MSLTRTLVASFSVASFLLALPYGNAQVTDAPAPTRPANAPPHSRLITLGTVAGPVVNRFRSETASLVVVGTRVYLVDCGDGTSRQLAWSGFSPKDVDTVIFTHLHFDHVAGLGPLIGYRWVWQSSGDAPLDIYGPPGTAAYVADTLQGLSIPEGLYAAERPPGPSMRDEVRAHDVDAVVPTVIYQDADVKVTAVENSHYITLDPAKRPKGGTRSYALRFDLPDRSIVFSGDTGPSDAVTNLARGADILVAEVGDPEMAVASLRERLPNAGGALKSGIDHMRREHLSPGEVGLIAAKAGVKMVVLHHIGIFADTLGDTWKYVNDVRAKFAGPVVAAKDGDEF